MLAETQSIVGDLLAPALLACDLTTPGSGMTLPAFQTYGYVRNGSPTRLVYVRQPSAAVALAGSPGAYWLALMHDTHSAASGWTRQAGTHYCWQAAATQPADPPGGLVMAGVTVTGANISAVDMTLRFPYAKIPYGAANGALTFDSALTYDEGSNVLRVPQVVALTQAGNNVTAFLTNLTAAGGTNRWAFNSSGDAPSYMGGSLQVVGGTSLSSTVQVTGAATLNRVGIAYAPDAGYWLRSGSAYIDSILTNGLTVNGLSHFGAAPTFDDAATTRANLGLQTMATQPHTSVTIVGGSVTGLGSLSAGAAPAAGFIATFGGSAYVSNLLGVRTLTPSYPVDVVGGLRASSIASGSFTPGQWSYDLGGIAVYAHSHVGIGIGATPASFMLHINGGAGKPGGGAWSDSSYRSMKRAIAPIGDALSLLLAQQGRQFEWTDETRAALLPGVRYGFIEDEVTLPQWREATLDGGVAIAANGFEALAVEAIRQLEVRVRSLEGYDE